ncbi:MAG TPA: cupredoxin domain-containing protein [Candidatus Woesebacteria bacterium]|nr:cupredoxin domain-containing protein [Candidatus Woesebacteria bacterium]
MDEPTKKIDKYEIKIIVLSIVIAVLTLFAVLVFLLIQKSSDASQNNEKAETIDNRVTLVAKQYSFSKEVIRVKVNEEVRIRILDVENSHGMMIPDLEVYSFEEDEIIFTPTKKGEYEFFCANPHCGEGHHLMKGKLIVA